MIQNNFERSRAEVCKSISKSAATVAVAVFVNGDHIESRGHCSRHPSGESELVSKNGPTTAAVAVAIM